MARCCGVVWTFFCVTALLSLGNIALATQFTVGGSSGWNTGVDYKTWAAGNTFAVGDSLEFPYSAGTHSVLEVSQADYSSCNTANAITSWTSGNTVVQLQKSQTYYFICGVSGHCQQGMQLSLAVAAASTNTTSPSSTSPSTPSSTTPSNTSPSTNSSSSSSAARMKVEETVLLLPAAMAILYVFKALWFGNDL